ncbi:hypothetical protein [Actinomadura hibisca]|uniref:hypothetical protein n=1 Tax=Actinomadura hibisca TaxID=68565 RepID=UPI0012F904E8
MVGAQRIGEQRQAAGDPPGPQNDGQDDGLVAQMDGVVEVSGAGVGGGQQGGVQGAGAVVGGGGVQCLVAVGERQVRAVQVQQGAHAGPGQMGAGEVGRPRRAGGAGAVGAFQGGAGAAVAGVEGVEVPDHGAGVGLGGQQPGGDQGVGSAACGVDGGAREPDGLTRQFQVDRLGGEVGQDVGAQGAVPGGFGQPQRLDPGALRRSLLAGVAGGERHLRGQVGSGVEQVASDVGGVGSAEQWRYLGGQEQRQVGAAVAAPVAAVQGTELLAAGADRLDVGAFDACSAPLVQGGVVGVERIAPSRLGDCGAHEWFPPVAVGALQALPQAGRRPDRRRYGRGEQQCAVAGSELVKAQFVQVHRAVEPGAEDVGEQFWCGLLGAAAAQPPVDAGAVVAQVHAVARPGSPGGPARRGGDRTRPR